MSSAMVTNNNRNVKNPMLNCYSSIRWESMAIFDFKSTWTANSKWYLMIKNEKINILIFQMTGSGLATIRCSLFWFQFSQILLVGWTRSSSKVPVDFFATKGRSSWEMWCSKWVLVSRGHREKRFSKCVSWL